jgi:uncharacterized membrane protein YkoI
MLRRNRLLAFAVVALLVAGTAVGIVMATGDDEETPITGDALTKASAAALQYTGGGTVTDSEVGDEEGYYEVEVTMADGTEVDVHLDENFKVIGSASDSDESEDTNN